MGWAFLFLSDFLSLLLLELTFVVELVGLPFFAPDLLNSKITYNRGCWHGMGLFYSPCLYHNFLNCIMFSTADRGYSYFCCLTYAGFPTHYGVRKICPLGRFFLACGRQGRVKWGIQHKLNNRSKNTRGQQC